jgi:hypothetical protein
MGMKEEMKKIEMTIKLERDGDIKKRDVRIKIDMVRIGRGRGRGRGRRRWR